MSPDIYYSLDESNVIRECVSKSSLSLSQAETSSLFSTIFELDVRYWSSETAIQHAHFSNVLLSRLFIDTE